MTPLIISLVIGTAILLAGWIVRGAILGARRRNDESPGLVLLQNQVSASLQQGTQQIEALRGSLSEAMQTLNTQLAQSLADSNKHMGQRLDATSRVIGDVRQQLGELETSSKRMLDVGKEINKLEQILRAPKLRGSLGELFLADLLCQVLPPSHYSLQHTFKGGETVDAVVRLQSGMVPIDAKFPLENFRRIFSADSESDRKIARKTFMRDVRIHVDAIATKYIRMDEGTFDFALMYVPAENVYYETIIKDDESADDLALFNYALKRRVIPVSPNSFYAYLQTIILGLKGMRVEESAREILQGISRLHQEFNRFSEPFRLVGQHLDNATKKFADAQNRFGKVESKMDQITGVAKGIDAEAPADGAVAQPAGDPVSGAEHPA